MNEYDLRYIIYSIIYELAVLQLAYLHVNPRFILLTDAKCNKTKDQSNLKVYNIGGDIR